MKTLSILLFYFTTFSVVCHADVVVEINRATFEYQSAPRLTEVIGPVALQKNWYWPVTKLYKIDSVLPERLRHETLQLIKSIQSNTNSEFADQLHIIAKEISRWQLAERINLTIDYDRARAQAAFNPRFESGKYSILLSERPTSVFVWGVVKQRKILTHRGATPVTGYINEIERTSFADKSTVYVLQPDGKILKTGVSYWNHQNTELMPGATIFIPFATEWFSKDTTSLNEKLLSLAVHRVEQ
jgi:hypothetical protein